MDTPILLKYSTRFLATSLLLACFIQPVQGDTARKADVDKLLAIWGDQESAVFNGKIVLRLFRYYDGDTTSLSLGRFNHLIDQLKSDVTPDDIARLLDGENTGPWKKDNSYLWNVPLTVVFEGKKVKNVFVTNKGIMTRAYDGVNEVSLDPANRQLRIDPGSTAIEKLSLRDLYVIPPNAARAAFLGESFERSNAGTDFIRIKNKSMQLTANRDTGLVSRLVGYDQRGMVAHERRALFSVPDTKNPPLARLVCHLTVKNHFVEMATIFFVENAKFNIELPNSEFKVVVPPAHTVFDYRKDPKKPTTFRANDFIKDAVWYSDQHSSSGAKRTPPRSRP